MLLGNLAFLFIQTVARHGEAMQAGGQGRFRLPQFRQRLRCDGLGAGGRGHFSRQFRNALGFAIQLTRAVVHLSARGAPANVQQQRLGTAQIFRNSAIAAGLPRLAFERLKLRIEGADDILQALQIGLGGA